MHVLYVWRRPPPPMFIGGAEISQRLLAEALTQAGHRVTYIGGHEHTRTGQPELPQHLARLQHLGITPQHDGDDGYHYQWRDISCIALPQHRIAPATDHLLRADPPDIVISSQEGSSEILNLVPGHITTIGWLHSISDVGLDVLTAKPHMALATSNFVANRCRPHADTRVVTFYPPFDEPSPDATGDLPARRGILMINPVPEKGSELVYQLAAAMPERPFTLVEGWRPTTTRPALANVTRLPPQWHMEDIYRHARLLLMPSTVEEAFGRVAIEAGLHNVPTIASKIGALPETLADGGIIVDPAAPLTAWCRAIGALDDSATHQRYAQAAHANARKYLRPVVHELVEAQVLTTPARNRRR